MKRKMVTVGQESNRGASILMSRASATTEMTRNPDNPQIRAFTSLPVEKGPKENFPPAKKDGRTPKKVTFEENQRYSPELPLGYPYTGDANLNQVDDNIFIGSEPAAANFELLKKFKISHIVNAAAEIKNYFSQNIFYLNLFLHDDPTIYKEDLFVVLEPAYRWIDAVIKRNPTKRILVHCRAGISRSASVVIYYLMRKYKCSYQEALKNLINKRAVVRPNPWYEQQLQFISSQIFEKN